MQFFYIFLILLWKQTSINVMQMRSFRWFVSIFLNNKIKERFGLILGGRGTLK